MSESKSNWPTLEGRRKHPLKTVKEAKAQLAAFGMVTPKTEKRQAEERKKSIKGKSK